MGVSGSRNARARYGASSAYSAAIGSGSFCGQADDQVWTHLRAACSVSTNRTLDSHSPPRAGALAARRPRSSRGTWRRTARLEEGGPRGKHGFPVLYSTRNVMRSVTRNAAIWPSSTSTFSSDHPGPLDVAERLGGLIDAVLHGVLEARGGARGQLDDLGDGHVSLLPGEIGASTSSLCGVGRARNTDLRGQRVGRGLLRQLVPNAHVEVDVDGREGHKRQDDGVDDTRARCSAAPEAWSSGGSGGRRATARRAEPGPRRRRPVSPP